MGNFNQTPMKHGVIQDFLNVPGIVGVALIDGMTPPAFYGFVGIAAAQQGAIAQSIEQVLTTTPDGFNSFEFEFNFYRVYLHKLNRGIILLVLTNTHLARSAYTQAVRRLLLELQLEGNNTITKRDSADTPTAAPTPLDSAVPEQLPADSEESILESAASAESEEQSSEPVYLQEILAAINALSRLTAHYLGTMVVANYWKATRPTHDQADWLKQFQIERSAEITCPGIPASEPLSVLTSEQHQCLRAWVAAFVERCSKVIRDFTKLVQQTLDERQRQLLFEPL
jgi:hypothetical protein